MPRDSTLGDFTEAGRRRKERANPDAPRGRPEVECDCWICSDDTITVCIDEQHRLLQIEY